MTTIREEQNERRKESGEPLSIESMLHDLEEEAADERTPEEKAREIQELLDLEKATRPDR